MIWLPLSLSGAISEAAGMILEKKIFKKHKVDHKNYTVFSFGSIVLLMLILIYFFWHVSPEAFSIKNLLIFSFVVVSSIIANLLIFYSLKRETVTELEPIRLMQPLFTILLAVILFSSERKWSIALLALIASISLIAAHVKKHHLVFDKYIIAALLGSLFFAVELVASKPILDYYNPFTFYFLRCLFVFIITLIIFHPKFSSITAKTKVLTLIVAAIWVFYRVLLYYGYSIYGVVFTTILFILAPVFIFLFARIFLKEKINIRQIISAIVIVACVVVAIVLQGG